MSATLAHGEFLIIYRLGVFIIGSAGIGKSTVALELLDRGHQLIADDVVFFQRYEDTIIGQCPELLKNYLALRDIGILKVTDLFGGQSIASTCRLDLIVNLTQSDELRSPSLQAVQRQHSLLDSDFPTIDIFVNSYRNLALVIETAVKNHILCTQGIDANRDFITKQQRFI
jgi:HPr kinase/phosphorylase